MRYKSLCGDSVQFDPIRPLLRHFATKQFSLKSNFRVFLLVKARKLQKYFVSVVNKNFIRSNPFSAFIACVQTRLVYRNRIESNTELNGKLKIHVNFEFSIQLNSVQFDVGKSVESACRLVLSLL